MDQVIVVHVLGVEQVTILLLAEIFGVNPIGPEEFLVCHAKSLSYGLCNQLGLDSSQRGKTEVNRAALGVDSPGPSGLRSPRHQLGQWVYVGPARGHFKISGDIFYYDNNHKVAIGNQRTGVIDAGLTAKQSTDLHNDESFYILHNFQISNWTFTYM